MPQKNLRRLAAGLQCMSKIGIEVSFEIMRPRVLLRVLDDAKTAFFTNCYEMDFFEQYQVHTSADETLKFKVLLKPLTSILRSLRTVERLQITFFESPMACSLSLRLFCARGIVKTHSFQVGQRQVEIYQVLFNRQAQGPNRFVIKPKVLCDILDQIHEDLENYPSIYQNFEKTIYTNLNKISDSIKKYQKLNLIALNHNQPKSLIKGFIQFCEEKEIPFEIIEKTSEQHLIKGELFIIPDDKILLRIIKKMKRQNFVLGQDIGVISYNDTLLKEIVEGGITTITTDFNEMGKKLAQMILNKEQEKIENPNKLIIRNSI